MIATLANMRAPGIGLAPGADPHLGGGGDHPACSSSSGPTMLAALVMLTVDRHFDGVFFDAGEGGEPLLFSHLSWIFFTGCHTILVLGAVAVISEIVPTLSRKPLFSHRAAAGSIVAIAVLGVLAWMQNMYAAPIPDGLRVHGDGRRGRAAGPDRAPLLQLDRDHVVRARSRCGRRSRWRWDPRSSSSSASAGSSRRR